jgi:predicted NAD/FAD-dependent oxidoreductase
MTVAVAIVGTGIAGLAAARYLRERGIACTLFDKSRGLGGRMATRRVDTLHFDHGAQFFTARSARFASLVAPMARPRPGSTTASSERRA